MKDKAKRTKADERRSTPGYVYGVAMHCKGQVEGKPECTCSCHLADVPFGAVGFYCNGCRAYMMHSAGTCIDGEWKSAAVVAYSHAEAVRDGKANPQPYMVSVADYWFITKGNTLSDELLEHFETQEKANKRAKELNDAHVAKTLHLTPVAVARRRRLKALGETFWVRYGDGPGEARWPKEPGRYAVESYSDRYSESFWETCATLDEVKAEVESGDVGRVVDLDTGHDVPFTLSATVG